MAAGISPSRLSESVAHRVGKIQGRSAGGNASFTSRDLEDIEKSDLVYGAAGRDLRRESQTEIGQRFS
jgi:hypothetical protein